MTLVGDRICLRLLSPEDVSPQYVSWLNDKEVTEFLEIRWRTHSLDDVREYVKSMNNSDHDFLFGIFLKESGEHIGNIKIGEINPLHRFGDVGLIIGNKNMWGKGYGADAIALVTRYGFGELDLNKLKAGMYDGNMGSYKAFIKAGYSEVGRYRKHRFCHGHYVDELLVEKSRDESTGVNS